MMFYVFSKKYRYSYILLKKPKQYLVECFNRLFRCNQTCNVLVGIMMSASCYVTSASHYQRRPLMYIRGLIPRSWPRQFRLSCESVEFESWHQITNWSLYYTGEPLYHSIAPNLVGFGWSRPVKVLHHATTIHCFSCFLFTRNRQNRNRVLWNICAGVRRRSPSSEVVWTEQSYDLFRNKMPGTA